MAGINGHTTESEFSDIEMKSNDDNNGTTTARGPWTHSLASYSRSVPQDTSTKSLRSVFCITVIACVIVFIVSFGLGIIIGAFAIQSRDDKTVVTSSSAEMAALETTSPRPVVIPCSCPTPIITTTLPPAPACFACSTRNPDESSGNEYKTSPFTALSSDEINKAVSMMINHGNASHGTRLTDNRISHVYLYPNNKLEVLKFLDGGGDFPGRFAKVHVFRGSQDPPDVMEYKVGPLHQTEANMTIEKLRGDGEINFNRRPYDKAEALLQYRTAEPHLNTLRKLFEESFDGSYYRRGINANFAIHPAKNESLRISKAFMFLIMGGYHTIRMIPVTFSVYHPGTDYSTWWVTDFYYLSQGPFASAQELQDAYNNGTLRTIAYPPGYVYLHDKEFDLSLNRSLPSRTLSEIPPPLTYEPKGPRYTIKGSRIYWMDWELEYTSDAIRGPAVYDVRFKGDRIAYEISLQDVTLLYASQSNGAGPPVISDTLFFLGNSNPPHLGIDCPDRAKVIELSMFVYGVARTKPFACVFEADGQDSAWKYQTFGLSTNYLIIRSMMNLGNYEYTVEWRLHLDGHLETVLSASGFLFGAFWDKEDPLMDSDKSSTPFGFRLAEYALGPIHDHAYAFKVDVDVLGTSNSFEILNWQTGDVLSALKTQTNATEVPGYFPFNNTRYIQYELVENEAGFVLNTRKPKYFTVVNENEKNLWGVKRGYRIAPHSQAAESFDDHVMFGPWGHLKYNLAVTRRKDSEPYATNSIYDISHPYDAFKGVGSMLDNETVRNEDLVFWITEKFYHAPSAEDLPMTLKVHRGFSLHPYNYFDRTPTFDVPGYYKDSVGEPYVIDPCITSKQ